MNIALSVAHQPPRIDVLVRPSRILTIPLQHSLPLIIPDQHKLTINSEVPHSFLTQNFHLLLKFPDLTGVILPNYDLNKGLDLRFSEHE